MRMPAPRMDPRNRLPAEITPAAGYAKDIKIWVHRGGTWRPGRVIEASALAVMVRYRPTDGRGTAVDTVTADHVAYRADTIPIDDLLPQRAAVVSPRGAEHDQAHAQPAAGAQP